MISLQAWPSDEKPNHDPHYPTDTRREPLKKPPSRTSKARMMEDHYFIFPVRNEMGFKVHSIAEYNQLMYHVLDATVQLQAEYPEQKILVVYEADGEL